MSDKRPGKFSLICIRHRNEVTFQNEAYKPDLNKAEARSSNERICLKRCASTKYYRKNIFSIWVPLIDLKNILICKQIQLPLLFMQFEINLFLNKRYQKRQMLRRKYRLHGVIILLTSSKRR